MALWASITNTTTLPAGAFTRVMTKRSTDTTMKIMPFMRALMGEIPEGTTPFEYKGDKTTSVSGGKGEIRWRGTLPTVYGVTTQTTAATSDYDAARFGSATFDLAQKTIIHELGVKETEYISGDQAKMNYVEEELQACVDALITAVGTDFHGVGDAAAGTVAGWRLAIQTDDTNSTYLGIARADAANANLRGNVDAGGTALTIARIQAQVNAIVANTGNPDLGLLGAANYGVLQGLVEPNQYRIVDNDNVWSKYGGQYLMVNGIRFALDGQCSATNVGIFDTSSWAAFWGERGISAGDIQRLPTKLSINVLPIDMFVQIVCKSPRVNARIVTN